MLPRLTFGVIVIAIIFYLVGARFPGIARRFGIA
jgi:hypothetical protein